MRMSKRIVQYRPGYMGLEVFDDKGLSFTARRGAFGRAFGGTSAQVLAASNDGVSYVVEFTQVLGSPDNSTGASNATPCSTGASNCQGDPQQTHKDFTGGVSGLGTDAPFPAFPATSIATLQGFLQAAAVDLGNGNTNTPLMNAAAAAVADLNSIAAQCVLYQRWDQPLGRSNARGSIYSNWLNTMAAHVNQANANLNAAAATEAGAPPTTGAGGGTYVPTYTLNQQTGGSIATTSAAGTTTILGMPLATALLLGGGAVLGIFLLLKRKKKSATAPAVTT